MIKLTVEGVVYEFDQEKLLIGEAREMKTLTRLSPRRWGDGVEEGDPDAVAITIYLAKKRAGETLRFSELDSLDYADIQLEVLDEAAPADGERLAEAVGDVQRAAEAAVQRAAADPTPPPAGTTPTDGTGATSPPSPTTSSTTPTTSDA